MSEMVIEAVAMSDIFLDHDFNCRDRFSPMDCTELASDIKQKGLLQPIIVRVLREEKFNGGRGEKDIIAQNFKYIIVAGHRRHVACKINKAETISANVLPASTSDFDCKDINAGENLQRKELSLSEECQAIRHYWIACWSREQTADRIRKSPGWVQVRYTILEMPDEIMLLASQGYIKSTDITELRKYRDEIPAMLKVAAIIRDRRKAGQTRGISHLIKKKDKPSTKKYRKRTEVFEMLYHVQEVMSKTGSGDSNGSDGRVAITEIVTDQGNSFATRCLAWCAGEISTGDFHTNLKDFCTQMNIHYTPPQLDDDSLFTM